MVSPPVTSPLVEYSEWVRSGVVASYVLTKFIYATPQTIPAPQHVELQGIENKVFEVTEEELELLRAAVNSASDNNKPLLQSIADKLQTQKKYFSISEQQIVSLDDAFINFGEASLQPVAEELARFYHTSVQTMRGILQNTWNVLLPATAHKSLQIYE